MKKNGFILNAYVLNAFVLNAIVVFILLLNTKVFAAEEALDLDSVSTPAQALPVEKPRTQLMGRVDLTSEIGNFSEQAQRPENELKNNHFFVFLKANPSQRTSFMGEIAAKSFFAVQLKISEKSYFEFGKIIVPFGDTRYFHHFYGGIQGYGPSGVMFSNIWAESGANYHFGLAESAELDLYLVNAVTATDATSEVDLQSSSENHQALGLRYSKDFNLGSSRALLYVSGYHADYFAGQPIDILGADLDFDYGSLLYKNLRVKMGMAQAYVKKSPNFKDYKKTGDYLQLGFRNQFEGELKLRYGTYVDNDQFESNKDVHNFNLGYAFSVDVIRFTFERQWNFEAVNEIDNDLYRFMASLDF